MGKPGLLKASDYPSYAEKQVTAHTPEEIAYLYSQSQDDDDRFFLSFFLGSGVRENEAAHAETSDLVGTTLLVKAKRAYNWSPKKKRSRKVEITPELAAAIKSRPPGLLFPNRDNRPNGHLLRIIQRLGQGGGFEVELHRLRKTWASMLFLAGVPLTKLQAMLGHESLETTQRYLADIELQRGDLAKSLAKASAVLGPPRPTLVVAAESAESVA